MRRREFITGLGAAAALPMAAARAQQQRPMPVIGFLAVGQNNPNRWGAAFYQGLKEAGYIVGQNVAISYRGAPSGSDRMLELATELVREQVSVILTSNDGPALAAKGATSTIPIVFFNIGSDPVTLGLVANINRPGGNITGASYDEPQVFSKRLDLLCQLVPTATTVAFLVRSQSYFSFDEQKHSLVAATNEIGRQLLVVECRSDQDLGRSFATIISRGAGAVVVGPLFSPAVVTVAAQYKIPTAYGGRQFVLRGGLMSYTQDFDDQIRLATSLVGQILNGVAPADLPVRRTNKLHFAINLKIANQLGLTMPPSLLAFANEVIE